ncbi:MAG TPA: glycosyltransferase family 4 protein, partial [Thermoanaerobaculia bacterium]|nr:glycosyltransferase family 4 protein [Thermoanaerobaculia bacterium]
ANRQPPTANRQPPTANRPGVPSPIRTPAIYAAFDRFPSRKGAAIHIDRFARTLFDSFGGGTLFVLGGPDLPAHQVEGDVEIRRFREEIPNFLDRALAFGAWLAHYVERAEPEIAHFRDPWSGAPIALRPHAYKTVYEVNALPSIELPSLFPDLGPKTLDKIRRIEMDCCAEADLIITPSRTTKRLLETLGVDETKIEVIPNGADLDAPAPKPDNAPREYILYFGAAQSWQGIDTLLRAFARLRDFEELRLVLCASKDSSAWRACARFAERLGIADRIVWQYELEEPELARWRQHALVSIAPLTDCERNVVQGCAPLKILESMASGTAVVASDVPPVREIIEDRENGWLVHPERPAELARAIRILLEQPEKARILGTNARRTIEERFTWERSTTALRRAYGRVMKGGPDRECVDGLSVSHG